MTDGLAALLASWGLPLIVLFNGLGRCGVPLPSSVLMILAGALMVTNQADLMRTVAVAYVSTLAGDIAAYRLGQLGGSYLAALSQRGPKVAALMARAHALAERHGPLAVLLTRWPLSTLGPYVNLAAGATGLNWRAFMAFCIAGELVWVSLYLGLGYFGRSQLEDTIAGASRATLIGGGAALAAVLVWVLWHRLRQRSG